MLPYRDSRITKLLLATFFVLVVVYAYFEARGLLFGPRINVASGTTEVREPLVHIKGRADRISALSMNGKDIAVTEEGVFDEPYLLADGLNRIVLDASDKYGRTTRQILQIVYTPDTSIMIATSSASTTPVAQ